MASTRRYMPVPAEAVWDVLADAGSYAYWVVGSKLIRDVDDDWPRPGSRFHHTVGLGPTRVHDHTEVLEASRPDRFVLHTRAWLAGTARVALELRRRGEGTVVHMTENPDRVYTALAFNPAVQLFTKLRNTEALMRLEELALRQAERKNLPRGRARGLSQAPSSA